MQRHICTSQYINKCPWSTHHKYIGCQRWTWHPINHFTTYNENQYQRVGTQSTNCFVHQVVVTQSGRTFHSCYLSLMYIIMIIARLCKTKYDKSINTIWSTQRLPIRNLNTTDKKALTLLELQYFKRNAPKIEQSSVDWETSVSPEPVIALVETRWFPIARLDLSQLINGKWWLITVMMIEDD